MQQQLDLARWHKLLDAYRDAQEEGPSFLTLQTAQGALTQARSDLERHRSRAPDQKGSANRRTSYADIDEAHARDLVELERRIAERQRETNRLTAKAAACGKRRLELQQLVDAIRQWAQAAGIALDDQVTRPAAVAVRGHQPSTQQGASPGSAASGGFVSPYGGA